MSNYSTGSLDSKNLSSIFKTFADSKFGTKEPTSYQVLSGSGDAWFYAPKDRSMIRVIRGVEVIILPLDKDSENRVHVIDAKGRYFLVPEDEIVDLGLN